jgi:hypothetical protein
VRKVEAENLMRGLYEKKGEPGRLARSITLPGNYST